MMPLTGDFTMCEEVGVCNHRYPMFTAGAGMPQRRDRATLTSSAKPGRSNRLAEIHHHRSISRLPQ
jgi:hypothetical protein